MLDILQKEKLPVTYVESYTQVKINPIFPKNVVEGLFSFLGLQSSTQNFLPIPVVYFTEYNESDEALKQCQIYKLTEL